MRKRFGLRKNEAGQSLVEFALVVPVLILLVMGIIEFGWLFNAQLTLTSAAREGARVAVVNDEPADIRDAIEKHVEGLSGFEYVAPAGSDYFTSKGALEGANLATLVVGQGAPVGASVESDGEDITVHLRGMCKPLIGMFVGNPKELWAHATMRME